jgi:molecular chaperone DnaK (HSP70)
MTYSIGIDLGTTHTAVSYFSLQNERGRGASQAVLPIPQVTAPGTVEAKLLLPSFLYLAAPNEFPPNALGLPWHPSAGYVVGELARSHGVKVPTRLVASAKSWLCHPTADRRAPLLPWQAPADVSKVSPVEASAKYLEHVRAAWQAALGQQAPLAEQEIVLTVPASFDAGARDLTLEAAQRAGLGNVTLLEEPQAALYAWLEAVGDGFRQHVKPGDVILVVDVGGGTSDFSLIAVTEENGALGLERLAVGDHILLGGDNMDLALGYSTAEKLKASGKSLDSAQLTALTYACRQAKEALFADVSLAQAPVVIAGRGSSLIGGSIKSDVTRAELQAILTEGFFPLVAADTVPAPSKRSGLAQLGLPYATDAAITRHLAAFLSRQQQALAATGKPTRPSAVLFNGGVFKAEALKRRVLDVLAQWYPQLPPRELAGADVDLAVARGAAYYGWVRQGHGLRIRGGTARAYYVGVEAAAMAVPGFEPPTKALCVAPFGMEEGSQADIPPQEFGLVIGEATRFRFFSSSTRRDDAVGTLYDDVSKVEGLTELPPIETQLPGDTAGLVPVNLQAAVTELGALELRAVEKSGAGRWKLELNVRGET